MSKSIASAILKDHGLSFVRRTISGFGSMAKTTVVKDNDGKRVQGILIAQYGPLDSTGVKQQAAANKFNALVSSLAEQFPYEVEEHKSFVVHETKRKKVILHIDRSTYNAYAMSANMDPGYRNEYIVPRYSEVTK